MVSTGERRYEDVKIEKQVKQKGYEWWSWTVVVDDCGVTTVEVVVERKGHGDRCPTNQTVVRWMCLFVCVSDICLCRPYVVFSRIFFFFRLLLAHRVFSCLFLIMSCQASHLNQTLLSTLLGHFPFSSFFVYSIKLY